MLTEMDLIRLNKLADRLEQLRLEKNIQVAELEARKIISGSWWWYFVHGRRFRGMPRDKTLAMLADAFGVPVREFYEILEKDETLAYAGVADEAIVELVTIVRGLPVTLRNSVLRVARELRDAQRG